MEVIPTIISLASKIHELVKKDDEIEYKLKTGLEKIKNELDMMNSVIMDNSSKAGAIDQQLVVKLQDLAYDVEDAIDLMVIDTNKTNNAPMYLGRVLRIVGIGDRRSRYILNIDDYQKRIDGLTTKWKEFFREGQPNGEGTSADAANPAAAVDADGRDHLSPVGIEHPKKDLLDLLRHVDGHPVKLRVISIVGFRGVGKTTLAWAVFKEHGSLGGPPFDCRAWVQVAGQPAAAAHDECMNKSNAARLLKETLCQLCPETNASDFVIRPDDGTALSHTISKLCHAIRTFLEGKRYLIVIDDVRHADVWSEMKDAFPTGGSSRIIVTTGVQSVATECSLGGFVYRLRGLNEKDSDELLWKLVDCERRKLPRDVQSYTGDIVRKCDGLPMALVGVAEYVRPMLGALKQGKRNCRDIAGDLGMYLADGRYAAFQRARRALVDCYEGLDSHGLNLKTCLLSVSMFPKRRGVRRKSLVRRWMAERLVRYDDKKDRPANIVALENFEELVDRIMIQGADDGDENNPVLVGEPGTVKKKNKCSVHGVLLDFLLHESATKRFARLIRNGQRLDVTAINSNPARRLAVVYDTDSDSAGAGDGDTNRAKLADMVNGLDLSRVRSLTVGGTVLSDSDLKGCKLLRVLDLDGCTGVTGGVLRGICKLKVLRYLSLRGTDARVLPPEMAELRFLETLDVRDIVMPGAEVQSHDVFTVTLPWNVLRLPYLKYLFGAFELPRDIPRRCSVPWPWTTAAAASDAAGQLDTLAGFFVGNDRRELQCLETLLGLMNRLKKLKIWWNKKGVTAGPKELPAAALTQLLVKFLKKRCFDLDSLSLDFGDQSLDFLNFPMNIHVPCKLRSIKLRGKLSSLPGIIIKADNNIASDHALTKLYLSFTGLSCEALLVLQRLPNLTYLKLVENSSGDFTDGTLTLNAGGFPSLRGLHVQAPKLPEVKIVAGDEDEAVAMQHLTTLQLLCGDVSGFQAADIDRFHQLEQVVLLKSSLDEGATKTWEAARKNHMNRPRLILCKLTAGLAQ